MGHSLRLGLRYFFRHIHVVLLFAAQFSICVFYLFYVGIYLENNISQTRGLTQMTGDPITSFEAGGEISYSSLSSELRSTLTDLLSQDGIGYGLIPSVYLPKSDYPLIVGLGSAAEILGLQKTDINQKDEIWIGAGITDHQIGDSLVIGQMGRDQVAITGRLRKGSQCFIKKMPWIWIKPLFG